MKIHSPTQQLYPKNLILLTDIIPEYKHLIWSEYLLTKVIKCAYVISFFVTILRLFLFFRLLDEFAFVVLLSDSIGDVCRYGSKLRGPLNVEHLVIEKDVWPDLLKQRPFRSPRQEESLVDLQAPAAERLQHASPGAGGAAGRDQVGSDGAVQTLILGIEFSLELPQSLQETL